MEPKANEGKSLTIDVGGVTYSRLPVQTHTVVADDDAAEIVDRYTAEIRQPGDVVIMSERVVAITQGRAIPIAQIVPTKLANFLQRFVTRTPVGIGLGSPWTMELALREVGRPRMLLAAAAAALTKPFGVKGVFYRVAGPQARAVDGPCDYTLPPYNEYATLGPADPDRAAQLIADRVGLPVVIIDANDLGVDVLGRSKDAPDDAFCEAVFRDNPLGQASQRTPIALVRRAG
ncbi:MAG: coenzyme F420-0:L-glutamate ligase [Actinomycetota bacterium]